MTPARRHVLFVCGKARMRSPTAAEIAPHLLGIDADFGGLSADAGLALDSEQIAWADIIAVMEHPHLSRLKRQFGPQLRSKRVVSFDIPDRYGFMESELVALLTRQFARLT